MDLGHFSLSLDVKDIKASRAFYEKFGFTILDGDEAQNWLILKNGDAKIGIFQGQFEGNIITFNPPNVRQVQSELKAQGVVFTREADETTTGPDYATLFDPDGNAILMDQHNE